VTWLTIAAAFGAFLALFATLQAYARATGAPAETTRKLFHAGSGTLTLAFPFLFQRAWPVLLLTSGSALMVGGVKFVRPLRDRLGLVTNRIDRPTLGGAYFPASVAILFCLARRTPLLFAIPVLILTFADAASAIVGCRYGTRRYLDGKSIEGSAAFFAVAFACAYLPLTLSGSLGSGAAGLAAVAVAAATTMLEACAWRGLDNLSVPLGGYLVLRWMLASN
jgi:phytol kinase